VYNKGDVVWVRRPAWKKGASRIRKQKGPTTYVVKLRRKTFVVNMDHLKPCKPTLSELRA
jgi:hypothetical protein